MLLAIASKRVGCSPFLPTTESDSDRERDSQTMTDRVSEKTSFRKIELERRESTLQRVRESVRENKF